MIGLKFSWAGRNKKAIASKGVDKKDSSELNIIIVLVYYVYRQ